MLAFEVKDMTCGHCVDAITKAVEAADPGAQVQVDLAAHRVEIHPVSSDRTRLAEAISADGYTYRCRHSRRGERGSNEGWLLLQVKLPTGALLWEQAFPKPDWFRSSRLPERMPCNFHRQMTS